MPVEVAAPENEVVVVVIDRGFVGGHVLCEYCQGVIMVSVVVYVEDRNSAEVSDDLYGGDVVGIRYVDDFP